MNRPLDLEPPFISYSVLRPMPCADAISDAFLLWKWCVCESYARVPL